MNNRFQFRRALTFPYTTSGVAPREGTRPSSSTSHQIFGLSGAFALGPILLSVLILSAAGNKLAAAETTAPRTERWWKGNLHTHSLWSDGDDYPEMIVEWYKRAGYHFLSLSDHNVMLEGDRWINAETNKGGTNALAKYVARFGPSWVQRRERDGMREVRLKPLAEFRSHFEAPDRFLLIPAEEITARYKIFPVHINATNLRDQLAPLTGDSVIEVIRKNVDAVLDQRRKTGQPMFPHLNHPNFGWGVTAEDLAGVPGERFFEVYNGHPSVYNRGDALHAGTDRIWDIALSLRLSGPDPSPLFGIGVDDSHNYHQRGVDKSNSGRGWVMVRAIHLTPESIVQAMEAGDFYASSGVVFRELERGAKGLKLRIAGEPGVTYRTDFIGTREGFNAASEPVRDATGNALPITRRYNAQVGQVFASSNDMAPAYVPRGDEIYVRARVTSSKRKANPVQTNEVEMAWTQPWIRSRGQ